VDPSVKGAQNRTPLHRAMTGPHEKVVEVLLENKADVNLTDNSGYTPLHYAGMFNGVQCAKMVLDAKANVNAKSRNEDTPLHLAAEKNNVDFVQFLLTVEDIEVGIVNSDGLTAGAMASKSGSKECASLLGAGGCCVVS